MSDVLYSIMVFVIAVVCILIIGNCCSARTYLYNNIYSQQPGPESRDVVDRKEKKQDEFWVDEEKLTETEIGGIEGGNEGISSQEEPGE